MRRRSSTGRLRMVEVAARARVCGDGLACPANAGAGRRGHPAARREGRAHAPLTILRQKGYEDAIRAAGRKAREPVIVPCGRGQTGGADALRTVLEEHPKVDAIVSPGDGVAIGALFECLRRAIDVPGRMRIAGVLDVPEARVVHPRLTTIRVDAERIGTVAAELVLARLAGKPIAAPVVGFELVAREST